jgi:hypothetical protein
VGGCNRGKKSVLADFRVGGCNGRVTAPRGVLDVTYIVG